MRINDETVIYHCDIDKALHRGVENRNLRSWEMYLRTLKAKEKQKDNVE